MSRDHRQRQICYDWMLDFLCYEYWEALQEESRSSSLEFIAHGKIQIVDQTRSNSSQRKRLAKAVKSQIS